MSGSHPSGVSGQNGSPANVLGSSQMQYLSEAKAECLAASQVSSSSAEFQIPGVGEFTMNHISHGKEAAGSSGADNGPGEMGMKRSSPYLEGLDKNDPRVLIHDALSKFSNQQDNGIPDDTKLLANPKGIIKSFLPQAAASDPDKFDSYRKLCLAHIQEFHNHQKGSLGASCLVCNMSCQHWNTLQRHLQTHIEFRPFACDICNRTFYSQSKLKRHQVIHNDIKPYKCPVCDRRLGRTEHLKRHLLVHTDNKPYGCSACSHTTKRLDGIRRHIKRKHGADGAEILALALPGESPTLESLRQAMSAVERVESKPKSKSKKKKKKPQTPGEDSGLDQVPKEALGGNLLDVAASFGVRDLRMPGIESGRPNEDGQVDMKQFPVHAQRGPGDGSPDDIKLSWDRGRLLLPPQPMQLLYQSLARNHPHPPAAHHLGDINPSGISPATTATTPQSFPVDHANEGAFGMNSPGVSMRYIPTSSGPSSAAGAAGGAAGGGSTGEGGPQSRMGNAMLLSPGNANANAGGNRYSQGEVSALPTEMMISQYFQSHQRFAPPVWGFANPNYQNY